MLTKEAENGQNTFTGMQVNKANREKDKLET